MLKNMQYQININIAVDAVKALSGQSLKDSIYLMDDSPFCSPDQGTNELCTFCIPGQVIHWIIYPIDLQTPAVIKGISFISDEENQDKENPDKDNQDEENQDAKYSTQVENDRPDDDSDFKTWTGIVPAMDIGRRYRYRLELQMGTGINSILSIDSLSLAYPGWIPPEEEENKQDQEQTAHE
ncbi:MAG: hypothetical protein LBJ72_05155 [Dysgonamonadaceae bacterium]|jgi:hypothetical protein|nr:hypothetical protein [Dysgonamonadaceae bacterium]